MANAGAGSVVCFLINPRSGGRRGQNVLDSINASNGKGFFGEMIYAFDISVFADRSNDQCTVTVDAMKGAWEKADGRRFLVIAGGDGTQKWGMEIVETLGLPEEKLPSIAILPLGTANELARVTGWKIPVGRRRFDLKRFIHQIVTGKCILVDLWDVVSLEGDEEQRKDSMVCFASFGVDAKVALKFDEFRNKHPKKANSVIKNKSIYVWFGLKRLFSKRKRMSNLLKIRADEKELVFPSFLQSIQVFNIATAADGINFWSNQKSSRKELQDPLKPALNDGLLEICGLRNMVHISNIKLHLSHSFRLAQSKSISFEILKGPIAFQIDGETRYLHTGARIEIKLHSKVSIVCGPKRTINTIPDSRIAL